MQIGSLSQAAYNAVGGMDHVIRSVEDIAKNVASGISQEPGDSTTAMTSELARLPALRQQAKANARVLHTIDELFAELASLPRK